MSEGHHSLASGEVSMEVRCRTSNSTGLTHPSAEWRRLRSHLIPATMNSFGLPRREETLHRHWRKGQGGKRGFWPAGRRHLEQGKADLPRLQQSWVDGGYMGRRRIQRRVLCGVGRGDRRGEVVKKADDGSFQVPPRRWVVERTFAWLLKCRRPCRDFEHRIERVVGFIYAAMLRLLVRRLEPSIPTS